MALLIATPYIIELIIIVVLSEISPFPGVKPPLRSLIFSLLNEVKDLTSFTIIRENHFYTVHRSRSLYRHSQVFCGHPTYTS